MSFLSELRYWFFPRKNPHPNIGMLGDLDDVEVLQDVEKHFGIRFSDQEAEQLRTVGDFFEQCIAKASGADRETAWTEFTTILAAYGTVPAGKIDPAMEFFANV
jgi:hypothetical protein